MELNQIKGIGPKTIEYLHKLNIYTIDDLVHYYPYRYNVYNPVDILSLEEDNIGVVSGVIESEPKIAYIKRNFNRLSFRFLTGRICTNVVIYNRAFLARNIHIGSEITLIGKYNREKNLFTANDIKLYPLTHTEVEPVYHVVSGIKRSQLSKLINKVLDSDISLEDHVPNIINAKYSLMDESEALREIHLPKTTQKTKQAQLKLKYVELFEFMFKINILKYKNQVFNDYIVKKVKSDNYEKLLANLPFMLTDDQRQALLDIVNDFNAEKRMNRLILGDVGSGKTIISFLALILNYQCGYQSALLSPTEVLAEQHYENFQKLFGYLNMRIGYLTGSLSKKEKKTIIEQIKNNEIDLVIGTHALLEENVEFANIGLVITDEQHRFGVNQRKTLQNKGAYVDVLYMSATPIPRTYALTIYGDMDISLIKEKPKGRKDIITKIHTFKDMAKVASEMEEEIQNHHQIYVVAPLIEEEEESDLNDVETIAKILKDNLHINYNVGILHGKMKPQDKDTIMNEFKNGNIDILISTTVIEVGVDVKNATMMIIFNAERFGLATLHQLRGRVGRNEIQSKCILITDKKVERLKVLEESNDGFYISEKDFEMRGSGDLFGIRQSGDMAFKIADLHKDFKILVQCKKDTEEFIMDNIETNFRDYSYYRHILEELITND